MRHTTFNLVIGIAAVAWAFCMGYHVLDWDGVLLVGAILVASAEVSR